MSPRFVVLEGLDGTGKSTVAAALAEALGADRLQTPQPDLATCRDLVESLFPADSVSQTLFYAACVVEASRTADRALEAGRSVVCDRYWASTVAYASAADRWVGLDGLGERLRVPDLTVLLVADEAVRAARVGRRGMSAHDRASFGRSGAIARGYEQALAGPAVGRLLRVDTTDLDPAAVVARVVAEVVR